MNKCKTDSMMVRRQNSFGRDLSDLHGNNPTPTFCSLPRPRDSNAGEVSSTWQQSSKHLSGALHLCALIVMYSKDCQEIVDSSAGWA